MSIDQDVRPGPAAGLDGLAPGAELVDALERLSPAALREEDLASYVRACARVQSRGTARLLDGLHHLGRAEAGRTERRPGFDEFSGDEVAAVLGWSRTMAGRKLDLADDLAGRLPAVGEALWEGRLDEPKATRLCEWTRDLAEDHARHVCQVLLPEAPELPVGELIRRIEQTAAALDPEWAQRRAQRAEKNARVILSPNPSGTATLSVCDVAAPDGLAMRDRVDALAAAVRALGVLLPIGSLRAAVAARLLDGSVAGLDDRAVALVLAAEYHGSGPADGGPEDGGPEDGGPEDGGPEDGGRDDGGPDDGGPDDGGPDDGGPDDGSAATDDRPLGEDATGRGPTGDGSAEVPPAATGEQGVLDLLDLPEPDSPEPDLPPMIDGPDPRPGRVRDGTSEIRLRLSTALGLDQFPASVPGYGSVLAHHARTMIRARLDGEWRVVLTDDHGRLQHVLLARRRPGPRRRRPPDRASPPSRAIVELQVPTTLLAALDPDDHGDWGPVLAELRSRLVGLGARLGLPPPENADDLVRRRPRAEVDRWVRVRDRHCVAPGCRRPAHHADLDHTLDHALGGPTGHGNLGVFDRHHHRAKHHAGWRVRQPRPGHFEIRTRAGVAHTTTPEPIIEALPRPRPAARPRPLPDDGWGPDTPDDAADRADAETTDRWPATGRPRARRTATSARRAAPLATEDAIDDPPPF